MTIPLDLLNKQGALADDEWKQIKGHVDKTADFIRRSSDLPSGVLLIAEQHHERLDGRGYPKQLGEGELNEVARMASIADIFTGLTDRRVYKAAMSKQAALAHMTGMKTEIDFLS